MTRSLPGQLREGMAAGDRTAEVLYRLWLQWTALAAVAVFAVVFTALAGHLLPHGARLGSGALVAESLIFLPGVLFGLVAALWPLQSLLPRLGVGPLGAALAAPALATAVLCAATGVALMLWGGALFELQAARPALTLLAMALAALPAMLLAQELLWPWRDRVAGALPGALESAPPSR